MFRLIYAAYIFAVIAFLLLVSEAIATQMPSKRGCAICHVMWLNDFRTEKETLIKWQPGNVLMKDTQGVVSAEDMCYSCHDGYVNDSRYQLWKYKSHPTFVKPSKNVTVPADLTLSVKGEIYCGTCHSPHWAGVSETDLSGLSSFLRGKNVDSSLCEKCHINQADFKKTNGHPLHITAVNLPDELFVMGSVKAKDPQKIICQTCHKVHGAKGERIIISENKDSALCLICHQKQKGLIKSKHDLRVSLPQEKNIKQQLPAESGPCGACHIPHDAVNKKMWARRLATGDPSSQMCLTCHGKENIYNIKQIGKFSHPINVEPLTREAIPNELPLFLANATKTPSGRVQCFTCHEVHQWDPTSPFNTGGIDVEGNASNSFLRLSNSISSNLCLACHVDKKQVVTSDHNLQVTAPDEKNLFGFSPKDSGPCGVCHITHNAAGNKLWAKELSADKAFVSQLCTGCHRKSGAAKAKLIGKYSHPVHVGVEKLNLTAPEKQTVKSLPLYDSDGNRNANEKIECISCHEPHIWNPKNSGAVSDYLFKNVEGDNTNSFLRKVNSPSSDLCKFCHADQALVIGTAHDLNVTVPQAKNLRGETVKESGQCGACHFVHNSPNKVKLWARSLGRIKRNESIMNKLCTSCHAKGNIAENKVPLIATHPRERLIINTILFNKKGKDYTPVFDNNGRKVNVGNISCPSCHNAHQWSYLLKESNSSNNPKAKGIDNFLRTESTNTVCVNCHGPEALIRYLYFHDPQMRREKIDINR